MGLSRLLTLSSLLLLVALLLSAIACGGGDEATPGPTATVAPTSPPATQTTPAADTTPEATAEPTASVTPTPTDEAVFDLSSSVFEPGEALHSRYSCDGDNISPPLLWANAPEGTQSYALIMDDPDAPGGTFVHWVLFNIPAEADSLGENITHEYVLTNSSRQGVNSWGSLGYGGPCPPDGTHRYIFTLYAVDTLLDLDPGATKQQLLEAVEGHVLADAELVGTYTRE
jgi:Raf kinase inhibitor-like YbhB/YbcL family protein